MKRGLRYTLAGVAGRGVLDAVFATLRIRVMNPAPPPGQFIYTLWHGRLLPLGYLYKQQGVATLVSRSGDGEYIAQLLQRWGFATQARGSSSRGGSEALRELVKAARAGRSIAVTPDGPRGPRQQLKPGVLTTAQLTGVPILPISAAASRAWWIEGWDRFMVPKPFATLFVRYGALVHVPRTAGDAQLEELRRAVENTLNTLTDQVDADAAGR